VLLTPDCVPCIVRAALSATRQITQDEETIKELITETLQIPALGGRDWNLTSVHVLEMTLQKIAEALGNSDPYKRLKDKQNQRGLRLYPFIKALIDEADDALYAAVNLAIIGNWIDVMWTEGDTDVGNFLRERLRTPVPREKFNDFRNRLERCELLVYLGDNSGEVLFDKALIETIRQYVNPEIVFVARSVPALNDITFEEAQNLRLNEVATLVENGIDGPMPGTVLSRCSPDVRDLVRRADLIFSKGGGNFDSFEEEKEFLGKTYFALMCKCIPYRDYFRTELRKPILATSVRCER
jgi:damage-control phosphatase, subfamily I